MINLQAAQEELKQKNYKQIQEETAWKWASRAAACYQNCVDGHELPLSCFTLGEEYFHEAVEHAALSHDLTGSLLESILAEVTPYQDKAAEFIANKIMAKAMAQANEQNPGN